MGESKND